MTTDEDLLTAYARGDFAAFDAFYRRHRRFLYAFLLSRLGVAADADEVLQETFLRLHRSIHLYDRRAGGVAWIVTIARNAATDLLRRRRRQSAEQSLDFEMAGDVASQERALAARQEVESILAKLRPDERALIDARLVSDESYENLVTAHGGSPEAVRQKLSRLLRRIKMNRA